jgi:lipopolysaccharide transport system permease protein
LGVLGLSCGIIISSLTTKYRDLSILVTFGVSLWMYITPIVYPMSAVGEGFMKTIFMINPVTPAVELLRYAVLGQGNVNWLFYGISCGLTAVLFIFGVMIFNKVEKTFMDTV